MRRPGRMLAAVLAMAAAGMLLTVAVVWRGRSQGERLAGLPAAFGEVMPRRVVWAWERPEDLRAMGPGVGVAYLAETLELGDGVTVMPRRQPMSPAAGAPVMVVVRLETRPGFRDSAEMRSEVARRLAKVSRRGGVRALQVDFDARLGERAFYAGVLRELRGEMPVAMPISMTALVSWCGDGSWLRGLPVEEAVPMYFRMGGPRGMVGRPGGGGAAAVTEPMCRGSVGVSTDEPWPRGAMGRMDGVGRVYVFAGRPWRQQEMAAMAGEPRMRDLEGELGR